MNEPAAPSHEPIRLVAPAKLTLNLRVVGVRDDGFHLVRAEMVSLDLHDVLVVDTSRSGLASGGAFAHGMPLGAGNLVQRALDLVGRRAHVTIDKNIPHGGGLGGGSADAAAILRWGGYHDVAGASSLGADVSFCLVGGRARVSGIGEIVEPMPFVRTDVTLVVPPLRVSTPAAYGAWDALGGPTADGPNDLEPAAIRVEPELAVWRDRIGDATGLTPILAGSGATWFVHGKHENALVDLSDEGVVVIGATTTDAVWAPTDADGRKRRS